MNVIRHHDLATAAQIVKNGGVIIYPTDTIWGMGCDGQNAAAVTKLRAAKNKPADCPLIWLLPSVAAVEKFCGSMTPLERKLLLQKHTTVVIHGQSVRVIRHGWLNHLLMRCGVPLVATSANPHGQPVVQSWRAAMTVFANHDVTILRGRKIRRNFPSTVVQVQDGQIKILRQGGGISINDAK